MTSSLPAMTVKHKAGAAVVLVGSLLGCGSADTDLSASGPPVDGGFGTGAMAFGDAGSEGPGEHDAGQGPLPTVRARIVHGIPNVGPLRACFDPDYVADDPSTPENEAKFGKAAPTDSQITVLYGQSTDYSPFTAEAGGAFTFHDTNLEDAPCSKGSLAAVLPLPFRGSYLANDGLDDAMLTALGLATRFEGTSPLTLLGSGVALDQVAFRAEAEASYLTAHPGDAAGAREAADAGWSAVLTARGPLFVAAREQPIAPVAGAVTLHLAHLVPDLAEGLTAPNDAVRLCVTQGTEERAALPVAQIPGIRFRTRARVGEDFPASTSYRFRVFASSVLDAKANGCATTGLTPIAQLMVKASTFKPGRSYTLLLMGADKPTALCHPSEPRPGLLAGCAGRSDAEVAASLMVLEDEGR